MARKKEYHVARRESTGRRCRTAVEKGRGPNERKPGRGKEARRAAGVPVAPGAMGAGSAKLEIMTPSGDRVVVYPGPGRRAEVYAWIVRFTESLNLAATGPSPFRMGVAP